ncbi:hypothetical protein B5F40_04790 [Gordonibacter sp. An230]|uniref:lectin like domain-containing protein n=1 Tax=Gordonibacter sp. An230 TaxID=1965592 RepID=UPI000B37C878|nr:lectin like domain-containing protein [Gordonibacter sp. An230]OUO91104.1 hypothetical protein B5F40_04790 [Gordonibacter sp. An230]
MSKAICTDRCRKLPGCARGVRAALAFVLATTLLPTALFQTAWGDEAVGDKSPGLAKMLDRESQAILKAYQAAIDAGEDPSYALAYLAQESYNSSESDIAPLLGETAPSEFYLTNQGAVTDVKFQNPWGSCWAFAAIAGVESSILKASGAATGSGEVDEPQLSNLPSSATGNGLDFSEHALAWFVHEPQTEESGGSQVGEGLFRNDPDSNATQMVGGMPYQAESALTSWQSFATEESVPYTYRDADGTFHTDDSSWYHMSSAVLDPSDETDARNKDWSVDPELRTEEGTGWRVSGTIDLPSPAVVSVDATTGQKTYTGYDAEATEAIQQTLMEVGAVTIAYKGDQSEPSETTGDGKYAGSGEHISYDNWCQYDANEHPGVDHAVTIVGWDDNYPASNFTGTVSGSPEGNGAWLVKNSWGADAFFSDRGYSVEDSIGWGLPDEEGGASGFFWLSYYDHTISNPVAYQVTPASESYDNNYQYDYLATSQQPSCGTTPGDVRVANVFTADSPEILQAVSAWTFSQDATVEIEVYLLDDEADSPVEGVLAAKQNAVFEYGGFHTVALDNPVRLAEGQRYAVVERVPTTYTDPATGEQVPGGYFNLESGIDPEVTATMNIPLSASTVSNDGETYYTEDGKTWKTPAQLNEEMDQLGSPMSYGSALIKAFTDEDPNPPVREDAVLEAVQGEGAHGEIVETYDAQALSADDLVAKAYYGEESAEADDLSFSYRLEGADDAFVEGLPSDAGIYEVSITLSGKAVGSVEYREVTATVLVRIDPATFSYAVPDQKVKIGTGLDTIEAPSVAQGVAGQEVRGALSWYLDEARAQPVPADYVFAGKEGDAVELHWSFAPAETESNYVSEPVNGVARLTLSGGGNPEASSSGDDGSTLRNLASTGDVLASVPIVLGTLVSVAGVTLVVAAARRRFADKR